MRKLVRDGVKPSERCLIKILDSGYSNPASYASNARIVASIKSLFANNIRKSLKITWPLIEGK